MWVTVDSLATGVCSEDSAAGLYTWHDGVASGHMQIWQLLLSHCSAAAVGAFSPDVGDQVTCEGGRRRRATCRTHILYRTVPHLDVCALINTIQVLILWGRWTGSDRHLEIERRPPDRAREIAT